MDGQRVREDIKNCQVIYRHSDYWIFCGRKLQSCFGQNGALVTYPEVKPCLHGIAMLPNNRLLIDDAASVLHLLDLEAGKVLKSKPLTKKRICQSRFALSHNGEIAFCVWAWGMKWYLVRIDLQNLDYSIYDYPASMYGVKDLVFKEPNKLLVLEVQNTEVDDIAVAQNQITAAGCPAWSSTR